MISVYLKCKRRLYRQYRARHNIQLNRFLRQTADGWNRIWRFYEAIFVMLDETNMSNLIVCEWI